VKQDDNLGPILFFFMIQAVSTTLDKKWDFETPDFRWHGMKADGRHKWNPNLGKGTSTTIKGPPFSFWKSYYVDNAAQLFLKRENIEWASSASYYSSPPFASLIWSSGSLTPRWTVKYRITEPTLPGISSLPSWLTKPMHWVMHTISKERLNVSTLSAEYVIECTPKLIYSMDQILLLFMLYSSSTIDPSKLLTLLELASTNKHRSKCILLAVDSKVFLTIAKIPRLT
jgi:hypothetical protein